MLHGIGWQTYERILEDLADRTVPRLTYDRGELEIMSPTSLHDKIARAIDSLVTLIALELELQASCMGSATFKREDIERGFEPDSSFYGRNEARVRGRKELDLTIDPPPDLVVEIDITSSTIDKQSLFAEFGVPEIWRYDSRQFEILQLSGGSYVKTENSAFLPCITPQVLDGFIANFFVMSALDWMKNVREWARQVKSGKE